MTFAHPHLLWLLALPLLLWAADRATATGAGAWPRIRRLWAGGNGLAETPGRGPRRRWRLWLGLAFCVVALARPQWGRIETQTFAQSREVLIALDLSRSMLAADVRPTRLERARLLIESLLDRLQGERVGLLLFAGTAFLQSPLSPDYEVLREFLPALGPDYLPEGGSNFDALLATALDSFDTEAGADRFLIVLSDGEAHDEAWRRRIDRLVERGVRVISLGLGTEAGAVMPAAGGGFVKDERGAVVLSRLNPATLRDLARLTGGIYADAAQWVDLAALLEQTVERGRQGAFTQRTEIRLAERFQWFLAAGWVLLAWSYWREFPVRPRVRDLRRRAAAGSAAALAAAALLAGPPPLLADAGRDLANVVGELSVQPRVGAADWARLARATILHGQETRIAGQPLKPGIVGDALEAVDRGEALDARAADWDGLRRQLRELLEPPPQEEQQQPPPSQQQQPPPPEQQEKEQSQDGGQGQPPPPAPAPEPPSPPPESTPPEAGQGQPPPEPGSEAPREPPPSRGNQIIGGQRPPDDELRENPELAVPLQKLEQVKQQDDPARLFQILRNDEPPRPARPSRDW